VSLVTEIGQRLTSAGVGSTSSTAAWRIVYRDFLPGTIAGSTKAQQIAITPTGGFDQEYAEALTYPTFQVRIRGSATSSTGLEAKAQAVVNALNLNGRDTLGSYVYLDILQQGDLLYLGRDENQRPIYAANFLALRARTT